MNGTWNVPFNTICHPNADALYAIPSIPDFEFGGKLWSGSINVNYERSSQRWSAWLRFGRNEIGEGVDADGSYVSTNGSH